MKLLAACTIPLLLCCASSVTPNDAVEPVSDSSSSGDVRDAAVGVVAISIAVAQWTACAVMSDGSVRCWGRDDHGLLGNGEGGEMFRATPGPVPGLANVTEIAANGSTFCARMRTGNVLCWGANLLGSTLADQSSPTVINALTNAAQLSVGNVACAVTNDQSVACWGLNGVYGLLGTGSQSQSLTTGIPVRGASQVSVSGYSACAVTTTQSLSCWGRGEIGPFAADAMSDICSNGAPEPCHRAATLVPGVSGITEVLLNSSGGCVLIHDGRVACWGSTIGDGTAVLYLTPQMLTGLPPVRHLADGPCLIMQNGSARCWGFNTYGQLGDGTYQGRFVPTPVLSLSSVQTISSGPYERCALTTDGAVWCWGAGFDNVSMTLPFHSRPERVMF